MQIAYSAHAEVTAAIQRIGRTEDVRFSPAGGQLAIAGFAENRILIISVEGSGPSLALTGFRELESPALRSPHGLAWLDERMLLVANRDGEVALFQVPNGNGPERVTIEPLRTIGGDDMVNRPGSLSVVPLGLDLFELLVCNNHVDQVSRHLLDARRGFEVVASEVLLEAELDLPDGVAHCPSGEWIAISNHDRRCVSLFRNGPELGPSEGPAGVLRGVTYPHGLAFADGGRRLIVADAGAPLLHVFERGENGWEEVREPARSIEVLDRRDFRRGNYERPEGGPKGISLSPGGDLLVTSCHEQPLTFLSMREILGELPEAPPAHAAVELGEEAEQVRAALLNYLRTSHRNVQEVAAAAERFCERRLQDMTGRLSWRMMAPVRGANSAVGAAYRRLWRLVHR